VGGVWGGGCPPPPPLSRQSVSVALASIGCIVEYSSGRKESRRPEPTRACRQARGRRPKQGVYARFRGWKREGAWFDAPRTAGRRPPACLVGVQLARGGGGNAGRRRPPAEPGGAEARESGEGGEDGEVELEDGHGGPAGAGSASLVLAAGSLGAGTAEPVDPVDEAVDIELGGRFGGPQGGRHKRSRRCG
jgi:hypothetical protein